MHFPWFLMRTLAREQLVTRTLLDSGQDLRPTACAQEARPQGSFVPKYKKLLHTTSVASVEDTAASAGIDLTDKNFWRSALQTIADQIDLFCQLVEE